MGGVKMINFNIESTPIVYQITPLEFFQTARKVTFRYNCNSRKPVVIAYIIDANGNKYTEGFEASGYIFGLKHNQRIKSKDIAFVELIKGFDFGVVIKNPQKTIAKRILDFIRMK